MMWCVVGVVYMENGVLKFKILLCGPAIRLYINEDSPLQPTPGGRDLGVHGSVCVAAGCCCSCSISREEVKVFHKHSTAIDQTRAPATGTVGTGAEAWTAELVRLRSHAGVNGWRAGRAPGVGGRWRPGPVVLGRARRTRQGPCPCRPPPVSVHSNGRAAAAGWPSASWARTRAWMRLPSWRAGRRVDAAVPCRDAYWVEREMNTMTG